MGLEATAPTSTLPIAVLEAQGPLRPRVVSLSTTHTALLACHLDAGGVLVGVDTFSARDARCGPHVAGLPTFDPWAPDADAIAALRPDLVIVSYQVTADAMAAAKLSGANFETLHLPCPEGEGAIEQAYAQWRRMADITGVPWRGERLECDARARLREAKERVERAPGFAGSSCVLEFDPAGPYLGKSTSLVGSLLKTVGMLDNLADALASDSSYPHVAQADLETMDPTFYIVLHEGGPSVPQRVAERGRTMRCWDSGRVVRAFSPDAASQWTPDVVVLVESILAQLTYGPPPPGHTPPRTVCFLGAATEIVCELGLASALVGRSHECKEPASVCAALPQVSSPAFNAHCASPDIPRAGEELLKAGLARYEVDVEALAALAPELLVVQDACSVCAVTSSDLERAAADHLGGCRILSLKPLVLDDVLDAPRSIGAAIGAADAGIALADSLRRRVEAVRTATSALSEPPVRAACLQWCSPLMGAGYWVPEMLAAAGAVSVTGEPGGGTPMITLDALVEEDPDVVVVMCCGYTLERALQDFSQYLADDPRWGSLRAVQAGRAFVADGDRFFNNSGPSVARSVELLAEMCHPDTFGDGGMVAGAYVALRDRGAAARRRQYPGQLVAAPRGGLSAETMATSCRSALIESMREAAARHPRAVVLLSGGVDTAAALEANASLPPSEAMELSSAVTVFASEAATDRPYAPLVAERHGLRHVVLDVRLDAVLEVIPACVRALETFDGMELRNAAAVMLGLREAKRLGATAVLTGDGADELLGGYSFVWGTDEPAWSQKRRDMASSMAFTTHALAAELGMAAESPFLTSLFIRWALDRTSKRECVGEREVELSPTSGRFRHATGKLCLRDAFPESPSAWRRKDPIQLGSGSEGLPALLQSRTSEAEFEASRARALKEDGVRLRDAESLYYFEVFKSAFPGGLPGVERPGAGAPGACVACGYLLPPCANNFCRVCGEWPATGSGG